jgi:hypothetical protein
MGIENGANCTCDLCGRKKLVPRAEDAGVAIEVDDSHVDRMWYTKFICDSCIVKIMDSIKKRHPVQPQRQER